MTKNDFKVFAECMSGLQEIFTPEKPLSKTKMELYFNVLQDLDIEAFKNGCLKLCNEREVSSTFPVPAEIRKYIQGNPDEEAIKAFDTFMRGKARTGAYVSVIFDDKTIHDVVMAFGGWNDICMIPESDWKYRRKEWIETYKAFRHNPRTDTPMKLIGIIELNNLQDESWKKFIPEPVRIGDGRRPMIERQEQKVLVE